MKHFFLRSINRQTIHGWERKTAPQMFIAASARWQCPTLCTQRGAKERERCFGGGGLQKN